ncbi:MAG: Rpn family recombination-promoting nuclease/putative transposase [Gammaproteobacteria bacterium]|nr:Rpn family recombination-promoting nuclease/putative transposase [Gammaproteobacteria bacterium]
MKFLDVKTDFAFKKVFGSEDSKDILLSFLNAVLDFGHGRQLTDLAIVDPYNVPLLKGMKDTYVDVKATLADGSRVIIEMQVLNVEGFEKRILYNAAKNYAVQLSAGENYNLLNPVIALTLTDFVMFEDDRLRHDFKLLEKQDFTEYSDDIELVFFELPKFGNALHELETPQDKWLYFIKNAGTLALVPENMEDELAKAFAIINEANMTQDELELQHKKRDWIYIQKSSLQLAQKQGLQRGIEQGIQQGLEQGIEQGLEQGRQGEKQEIVIKARQAGLAVPLIQAITGLSEEAIEAINADGNQ